MDNIALDAMKEQGIAVMNTPGASSSSSVAELVFAYLFAFARHIPEASREMPANSEALAFNDLKKAL